MFAISSMMHAWLFFYHLNHKAGLHQDEERVQNTAGSLQSRFQSGPPENTKRFYFLQMKAAEEEEVDEKYVTTHYYPHIGVQQQSNNM